MPSKFRNSEPQSPPPKVMKKDYSLILNVKLTKEKWEREIRRRVKIDVKNSQSIYNHLNELSNSPNKMRAFVEDIFFTLHTSANDLSMIEFKEFYDLTAKGLSSELLDIETIMNEFKLADTMNRGKVSKEELKMYVTKLYKYICDIIANELSQIDKSEKKKTSNEIEFTINPPPLRPQPPETSYFNQQNDPFLIISKRSENLQSSLSTNVKFNSEINKNKANSIVLPPNFAFVSLNE